MKLRTLTNQTAGRLDLLDRMLESNYCDMPAIHRYPGSRKTDSASFSTALSDLLEKWSGTSSHESQMFHADITVDWRETVPMEHVWLVDCNTTLMDDDSRFDSDVLEGDTWVSDRVRAVIGAARHEEFEDGVNNALRTNIETLIAGFGLRAVVAISDELTSPAVLPEVAAEVLRCLGSIDDSLTREYRRHLLEHSLMVSQSSVVRDGAGLGLAAMDDPRSLEVVRRATAAEACRGLRRDLQRVVDQLEQTRQQG